MFALGRLVCRWIYAGGCAGRRAFRICIHWREECPTISRRRAPRGGWGICSSSMAGYRCRRRRSGGLLLVGHHHHQKKKKRRRGGGWGAAMRADRRWWSCATATAPTSTATAFTCVSSSHDVCLRLRLHLHPMIYYTYCTQVLRVVRRGAGRLLLLRLQGRPSAAAAPAGPPEILEMACLP